MLSEERIKLMTHLATFEKQEGKKYMAIGSYFRSDYMGLQIIKSIIAGTLAYLIILGMYVYYKLETIMQDVYKMDLLTVGKKLLFYYLIFVAAYSFVTYIIYAFRYAKAKRKLRRYYSQLRQLSAMYDLEKNNH